MELKLKTDLKAKLRRGIRIRGQFFIFEVPGGNPGYPGYPDTHKIWHVWARSTQLVELSNFYQGSFAIWPTFAVNLITNFHPILEFQGTLFNPGVS